MLFFFTFYLNFLTLKIKLPFSKALNAEYHQEAMVGITVDIFPQPSNIDLVAQPTYLTLKVLISNGLVQI